MATRKAADKAPDEGEMFAEPTEEEAAAEQAKPIPTGSEDDVLADEWVSASYDFGVAPEVARAALTGKVYTRKQAEAAIQEFLNRPVETEE